MITHNGKYLLHATHHGMPIVAATLGGKMVILPWLLSATQLAIVAAFGAEGTEVIRKTNDYLNRIATTDPQRALLLAGFINEDPMLVCSLVETSKTRWLVGDGKAWIDTKSNFNIKANKCLRALVDARNVSGYAWNGINYTLQYNLSELKGIGLLEVNSISDGSYNRIRVLFNDANVASLARDFSFNEVMNNVKDGDCYIFAMAEGSRIEPVKCGYGYVTLIEEDTPIREMYPFHRNGENGMLDIISGTFHPNANTEGAFTIQLTDK